MAMRGHRFDPSILREYDIRGIVGRSLTAWDALALGRTLGAIAARRSGRVAIVGYDGRTTSPALEEEVCRGLASSGLHVLRIGMVPTPCVYFACKVLGADVGVMVTGSHNPPDYNGFKMVLDNKPFFGDAIQNLGNLSVRAAWVENEGSIVDLDAMTAYIKRILQDYGSHRGLRVAWDAGNGVAGPAMVRVASNLPGEHILLNENVDGSFPNHHPDPTVEKNLEQLRKVVLAEKCDLGIAFDGDGDRIGVIDEKGEVIWGDQLLALLSREVLKKCPGMPILADVKASQVFFDEVARLGGQPIMCRTGHSLIKDQMALTNAPLAGEMSGHIFFNDQYFGYDDALYAAIRVISFFADAGKPVSEIRASLPAMVNTPEIRVEVPEERKFKIIEEAKDRLRKSGAIFNDIDGVRVKTDHGWWLLRASNTQNALVLRCESDDRDGLAILKTNVADHLRQSGVKDDSLAPLLG